MKHTPTADDVLDHYSLRCEELGHDAFDEVVAKFPQHKRKLSEFRAFRAITRALNPIVDRVLTYRPKAATARARKRARKK